MLEWSFKLNLNLLTQHVHTSYTSVVFMNQCCLLLFWINHSVSRCILCNWCYNYSRPWLQVSNNAFTLEWVNLQWIVVMLQLGNIIIVCNVWKDLIAKNISLSIILHSNIRFSNDRHCLPLSGKQQINIISCA